MKSFVHEPVSGLAGMGTEPWKPMNGHGATHAHRATPLQHLFHIGNLVFKAAPTSHGAPAKVVVELWVVPARIEPGERAGCCCSAHVLGDDGDLGPARVAREMPCDRCADDAGSDDDNMWPGLEFRSHVCIAQGFSDVFTAMLINKYKMDSERGLARENAVRGEWCFNCA